LATKSEGVGLIARAISFQDLKPLWSQITNVTHGRTDRRTRCDRKTPHLELSALRGKQCDIVVQYYWDIFWPSLEKISTKLKIGGDDLKTILNNILKVPVWTCDERFRTKQSAILCIWPTGLHL